MNISKDIVLILKSPVCVMKRCNWTYASERDGTLVITGGNEASSLGDILAREGCMRADRKVISGIESLRGCWDKGHIRANSAGPTNVKNMLISAYARGRRSRWVRSCAGHPTTPICIRFADRSVRDTAVSTNGHLYINHRQPRLPSPQTYHSISDISITQS